MKRKPYRKSLPPQQRYVVINREGEIYTGLIGGCSQWSYNWDEAKPLHKENTSWLLQFNPGAEIIKEEEI